MKTLKILMPLLLTSLSTMAATLLDPVVAINNRYKKPILATAIIVVDGQGYKHQLAIPGETEKQIGLLSNIITLEVKANRVGAIPKDLTPIIAQFRRETKRQQIALITIDNHPTKWIITPQWKAVRPNIANPKEREYASLSPEEQKKQRANVFAKDSTQYDLDTHVKRIIQLNTLGNPFGQLFKKALLNEGTKNIALFYLETAREHIKGNDVTPDLAVESFKRKIEDMF